MKLEKTFTVHRRFGMLGVAVVLGLWSLGAQAQTAARLTVSADGLSVTDSRTGLTWQRCAVGLVPPACTGTATIFSHEQALAYAATQTGWRLPNIRELNSLIDRSVVLVAGRLSVIDAVAFPNAPILGYWSSTPSSGNPGSSLFMNGSTNILTVSPRTSLYNVWLVR